MTTIGRIEMTPKAGKATLAYAPGLEIELSRFIPLGRPAKLKPHYNPEGIDMVDDRDLYDGEIPENADGFVFLAVESGRMKRSSIIQFYCVSD